MSGAEGTCRMSTVHECCKLGGKTVMPSVVGGIAFVLSRLWLCSQQHVKGEKGMVHTYVTKYTHMH